MALQTQTVTADELLHMPDGGFRYELVRGELRQTALAGFQHGQIAAELAWRLAQYADAHRLGVVFAAGTGFQLSTKPDTVRAPDVAFVSQERVAVTKVGVGYWPEAPDLAAEVISPGDTYTEVEEKVFGWLEAGTRMVLVVNPRKRTVTVYHSLTEIFVLTENDQIDGGSVVPCWTLAVRDLFAP